MEKKHQPTAYPEVNTALKTMADSIHDVLGEKFVVFTSTVRWRSVTSILKKVILTRLS